MKIGTRHTLAVMVLALLGAGCADQPQPAGPAVQPANVAAAAAAAPAPAAANNDDLECDDTANTGTMIHKKVCTTASQRTEDQRNTDYIRDEATRPLGSRPGS
jgi:hypothetical protein